MNVAVQERPGTSLTILQKCFAAGVDINCTNNLGETALHLLIQSSRPEYTFTKENEQFLRCLLENRADINLQTVFGISPIFQCWNCDAMSVLLEMEADLNIQDKFGRTPLLAMLIYRPSAEEIEQLLVKDACLNQRDFHGNNALHYAVWHALNLETIFYMINNGIENTQDKQGTLPCELALQRQNRELFCILSEEGNIIYQRYMFEFQEHIIEYKDLVRENFEEIVRVTRCLNLSSDDAFTKLLGLPYIGRVSSEDEANLIRSHVTNLVNEIGRKLKGREKMFSNSIVQSGSIGEETKICYPDEFDFVCILDMFGKVCERDEGFCGESGFTVLKLKENADQSNIRWFFDRKGRLSVNAVRVRFAQLVREILYDPKIWTSPFISFHFLTYQDYKDEEILPTCQFSINWEGRRYKDLIIKIDLVPACQIANWWPENTDLQKVSWNVDKLQKYGCLLLFQCTEIFQQSEVKLRVSALPAEKMLMGTISKTAIDSYMFSKLLCTDWVCLVIVIGQESFMVNEFITSHMLKNCTFHVFYDNKMKGIATEDIKSFTIQIFKTLLTFCETGNFPAFIFSFQNIFSFQCKQPIESIRKKCICRSNCAKIILTILGEKQIFTELSNEDIINTILESGSDDEFSLDECQDAVGPLELLSNHSDFDLVDGEK
ncbi:Hypothetical predicted protein [Mytilus galloprovincialis]|nr:Hypothetical predicted protein [Mytilus galloprovincialis]